MSERKKKARANTSPKKTAAQKTAARKKSARKDAPPKPWYKRTIAERTAAFRSGIGRHIGAWIAIALLLAAACVFRFCMVGYSFSALVCVGVAFVVLFYTVMPSVRAKHPRFGKAAVRIFTGLLCIGLLAAGVTEALIIRASFGSPDEEVAYLVVLGAKVRADGPSLSLQNRIDAAYDYLTAHPDTIAVVSGGQGTDEHISEAQCMYDSLTEMGIDADRIWIEDEADSTWENLRFSIELIRERTGNEPEKLGVLSSEYHLFRASLFAKACGVEFVGVPARTTNPVLMVNYFLREIAGVWHYLLLGGNYDG